MSEKETYIIVNTIIIWLVSFIVLKTICNAINAIKSYFINKGNYYKITIYTEKIPAMINTTTEMFNLIDMMINVELINLFVKIKATNKMYDNRSLDKDTDDVSNRVLHNLNNTVFNKGMLMVTDDYIFIYVRRRTFDRILETGETYNSTYRSQDIAPKDFLNRFK